MKDVFISKHDGSAMYWTEQIAMELESRGISVWYSPRDVISDYPTDIVNAIRNCKVFLFLFNEFSNMSEHCKNELSIAFDRYRLHDGISLLSFKTSNENPGEDIYYFLTRVHVIDGTIPPEAMRILELCDRISVLLDRSPSQDSSIYNNSLKIVEESEILKTNYRLKGDFIYPDKKFMGRQDELELIHRKLQGRLNKLMIVGMGGIGKTELAKQYAFVYAESYDITIWIHFRKSIRETISDDTNLIIEGCSKDKYSNYDTEQYFQYKLKLLKKLSNRKTLLIIDNFDVINDSDLEELCNGEYTVLFTTRTQELSTFVPEFYLDAFQRENELLELFKLEYKRSMTEEDKQIILKMVSNFQNHTLLVRLLGNAMQKKRISPRKMQSEDTSYWTWMKMNEVSTKTILEILQDMIRITDLSKEESYILCNLSLIPNSGIDTSEFVEICGMEGFDVVDNLIKCNWIVHEPAEDRIHLHPLIREVFIEQSKSRLEICEVLVKSMINRCRYTHSKPWKEKVELYNIITSICEILPEKSELYLCAEYACVLMNMDMGDHKNAAGILREMLGKTQIPEYRCRLWNKLAQTYTLNGSIDRADEAAKEGYEEIYAYSSEYLDESIRAYHLRSLLERLSEISRKKGKCDESILYAEKALKLSEHIQYNNGERSYGWSLYHLASCYVARGLGDDLNYAEITLQKAVKIFSDLKDDGAVFYCNHVYGQILVKKKKFMEAIQQFDCVYEGMSARFGEEHPDIANLYVDYGVCYALMNNIEKAKKYYRLAEMIYERHEMTEKTAYVHSLQKVL